MKKRRVLHRLLGLALAAALAFPLSALAYGPAAPDGFPDVVPGKTLVGVQTSDVNSSVLSYSVPLYVTLAVTNQNGTATVLAPDDYRMFNNSLKQENTPAPIAVTGIAVTGVKNRTWNLTPDPKGATDIKLTLGGVVLPELKATDQGAAEAIVTTGAILSIKKENICLFWTKPMGVLQSKSKEVWLRVLLWSIRMCPPFPSFAFIIR